MARVHLKNVTKKFRKTVAVDDLTLCVEDKTFVVLLGPSGSGKSTVLNLIAGLEKPDKGEIYIGDELVNEKPPEKRDIAMVFQTYALYPFMTAFDNIAFPLKLRKFPKDEIKRKIKNVSDMLGIQNLLDRKPYEMSGGERQRIALARAIVREPKAFLLDEPLSNLDAKLRVTARMELKKLHRELKSTFVYVTHDQIEAFTLGDKIALLEKGRLQQFDTPESIYDHPVNTFVAGFVGSPPINFINCTFSMKDDEGFIETSAFKFKLPKMFKEKIKADASGSELILGIRPEHIQLFKKKCSTDAIEVEVYLVEPAGSEIIVDLSVGENIIKAKSTPEFKAEVGEKLWITFDESKIHVFDRKTEKAIL